ncbi:hypothetical protein [Streptomyces blattellae]|nr:hypothetical protein [Streptomyces blattellae]
MYELRVDMPKGTAYEKQGTADEKQGTAYEKQGTAAFKGARDRPEIGLS